MLKLTLRPAKFAKALILDNGVRLPQTISHRGYKAAFPENTMASFTGAVEAGTHALETDIHLTKDDVVVLSHVCDVCHLE
jgi:glycerophosphoryl diester phosphodiesterase